MEQLSPVTPSVEKSRPSHPELTLSAKVLGSLNGHRSGVAITVAFFVVLTVADHYFRPSYIAKAALLVQRAENSPLQALMGRMTGNANYGARRNEYLEKYFQYLNSREFFLVSARALRKDDEAKAEPKTSNVLRTVVTAFRNAVQNLLYVKVVDPSAIANEVEELAGKLSSSVRFVKSSQDNLTAEARARNPMEAVRLANALSEVAVKVITESELKELNDAKRYIEAEQASTGARLQEFDSAIVNYRNKNKLVKTDAGGREALEQVSVVKRNLDANQIAFEQNERLIAQLTRELEKQDAQFTTPGARSLPSSEVINELRDQIQGMRYKKMLFQAQGLSDDGAQIQSLDQEIENTAARLKERIHSQGGNEADVASLLVDDKEGLANKISYLKRENQYLGTSIQTLNKAFGDALRPLDLLPAAQQTMLGFNRNTQLEFSLLQELRRKTLEIELERAALDSKIRFLEKATMAGIPARYNIFPKAILAAIFGLLFSIGVAYLFDSLSDSIKSKRELEELGMVVVGSVPRVEAPSRLNFLRIGKGVVDILAPWKNEQECGEVMAFKHIRATVLKMRTTAGDPAKKICILGATPGDGKSFLSANIGLALAQMGKKTLILDGDLRRPTLGLRFGIKGKEGLTSILMGDKMVEECISRNVLPNLDVLPSGPIVKRATELLSGGEFSRLLDGLNKAYEYIIIDTPPVLPVVDGLILSSLSDATVFAVSHRKTKISDIDQAMEKVRNLDDRPIFVVYNRVDVLSHYSYVYVSTPRERASPTPALGLNLRNELASFKKAWRAKSLS